VKWKESGEKVAMVSLMILSLYSPGSDEKLHSQVYFEIILF
jgi:hypothetical protein